MQKIKKDYRERCAGHFIESGYPRPVCRIPVSTIVQIKLYRIILFHLIYRPDATIAGSDLPVINFKCSLFFPL